MKTRNFILFVLTAVVCGAFLCADSQAKVCFLGEDCGSGGNFGDTTPVEDMLKDACSDAGYDKTSCTATEYSYVCPYKSKYKKCCPMKYRFEACIYPTEVDVSLGDAYGDGKGKCGIRYSCTCPSEYKITSDIASSNNCQPGGGYCLLNDGSTDTVKYKTCTCDRDIFTDEGECLNNQSKSSSCKDSVTGKTYSKCYCDRSSGGYPYANCEHGLAAGAKTCIDSNSKRSYYSECKSAEDWCKDEGYKFADCSGQRDCYTENKVTYTNEYGYEVTEFLKSDNCILGKQCPRYAGLYQCTFDKASWCTKKGYGLSASSKKSDGSSCYTPDGISGTVVNCPANDGTALYYYKCKVRCDQRVKKEAGISLYADTRFGDAYDTQNAKWNNAYWIKLASSKNGFRAGYHLFLRDDVRLPDAGLAYGTKTSGDKLIYAEKTESYGKYKSINGIGALYKLDPVVYSDCQDEYESSDENPKLTIPLSYANSILSRDFNNIDVTMTYTDEEGDYQKGWCGKTFSLSKESGASLSTYIWNNLRLRQIFEGSCEGEFKTSSRSPYATVRTLINADYGVKLKFTGRTGFNLARSSFDGKYYSKQPSNNPKEANIGRLTFKCGNYCIFEFVDVTPDIGDSYSGPDFDAAGDSKGGVLKLKNSTLYANQIFSYLNVDLDNSTVHAESFNVPGYHSSYEKNTTGMIKKGTQYCVGATIRNKSKLYVRSMPITVFDNRYLYVSEGSVVNSTHPIILENGMDSVVCIADSNSKVKAYGVEYTTSDSTANKFTGSGGSNYMTYYDLKVTDKSKRVMWMRNDESCIPPSVNKAYNSSSVYADHCVGYKPEADNFQKDHLYNDDFTIATPAAFSYKYAKSSYGTTWQPWYPRSNADVSVYRAKGEYTSTGTETVKRRICRSYSYDNSASSQNVHNDVYGYYNRGCSTNNKCYGRTGARAIVCSGCSTCSSGVAHADWTDSTGGR